ncbi:MAG: methyltransferase domain-containing protein [Terracidiphilus sp.]|jgi:SAM-dependent methyltransferase
MQLSAPDFSQRAQLTELMDEPCSRDVLRACLRDIARTNRWTFAYRPLIAWLNAIATSPPALDEPLRILDVGCGYGDGLRRIEQWAESRRISVELTGLDLNPDASAIAAEATSASSKIQWVTADILTYIPGRTPHLVVSSLFTHHLDEDQIVEFIRWMEDHAQLGWFINDLSRAPVPYYLFRTFAKLARLHHFVQYDGPVSIARSFVATDWERMCSAAGMRDECVEIQAFRPARLCVSRRKAP